MCQIVTDDGTWLAASPVPKLFINADPGAILTGPQREWVRSWRIQQEITVPGSHFLQEDSGTAIGRPIAAWYGHPLTLSGGYSRSGAALGCRRPCTTISTRVSAAASAASNSAVGLPRWGAASAIRKGIASPA